MFHSPHEIMDFVLPLLAALQIAVWKNGFCQAVAVSPPLLP